MLAIDGTWFEEFDLKNGLFEYSCVFIIHIEHWKQKWHKNQFLETQSTELTDISKKQFSSSKQWTEVEH